MHYHIEANIPVPTKQPFGGATVRAAKYPYAALQVGDSFLVSCNDKNMKRRKSTMRANSSTWGKKLGRKFTTRVVEGGVRVWRIE